MAGAFTVDFVLLGLQHNRHRTLGSRLVKRFAEQLRQAIDDAVVAEKDVVLGKELPLGLVLRKLGLELGDVDDAPDALAQARGELVRGYNVLVCALRVGGDEADGNVLACVERVRQRDLAWLEACLVGDVALGCQRQPDGRLVGETFVGVVFIIFEEVALGGCFRGFLGGFLDV